ncbi:MAG: type II toxin-antitoxin system HicA family toxin [Phycisphaerae bacterium]
MIKELVKSGCYLKRHSSKHDIYANPRNGKQAPVPRHTEIKDSLVRLIKKQLII